MKVYIRTYGCQANIHDSEIMAGILNEKGHKLVDNEKDADIIILNSCSVKNSTQSKEFQYINDNQSKKLFVGGCLTKTVNLRKKFPNIRAVFDTNSITKIDEIITSEKDIFSKIKEVKLNLPVLRKNRDIGITIIQEGCTNNCSFCSTKLARGALSSYRIGDIKRELEKAVKQGCKKIYLTGQDTGAYGLDIKTDLPSLLKELVTVEGNYKIRVGMMNPWHAKRILDDLIEVYKNEKIIKFLHIPVQSGSENVLKNMLRIHTVKNFKEIVNKFKKEFPKITIATDVIVGYPTETEEDFIETLNLIGETNPQVLNISMFSSRPGTRASKLKQLPSETIKDRSRRLTELYKKIKKKEIKS